MRLVALSILVLYAFTFARAGFFRRHPVHDVRWSVSGDPERIFLGLCPSGSPVHGADRAGGKRDVQPHELRLSADAREVALRLQPSRLVQVRPG